MNRSWVPVVLLLLVVAWGTTLRLANLGDAALAGDEANHYYAARGLAETGRPALPSGIDYSRGIDYTRLAGLTSRVVEPTERGLRLPAAILGSLAIVVIAAIGWILGGPWMAFWAALLLVLYPEALRLSRFTRFYTLQLIPGLVALYTGWRAFGAGAAGSSGAAGLPDAKIDPAEPNDAPRRWAWILVTLLLLAWAARIQMVSLTVGAVWLALMALQGVMDWRRLGRAAWIRSAPLQLTAIGLLGLAVVALARPELLVYLTRQATTVPMWTRLARPDGQSVAAYYRALSAELPIVVSLAPAAWIVMFLERRRLAIYLGTWSAATLAIHSVALSWKQERFVLLAIPAVFLIAAYGATRAAGALRRFLEKQLPPSADRRLGPDALVAVLAIVAIVTQPAFNTVRRMPGLPDTSGWRESSAILAAPELATVPVGSTSPLPALFYWGRLSFAVQPSLLESWSGGFRGGYVTARVGSKDRYAGVPVLPTADAIRQRFEESGSVLIGFDQRYVESNNIDSSLVSTLESEATDVCRNRCGTMRLFHWRWNPPEPR